MKPKYDFPVPIFGGRVLVFTSVAAMNKVTADLGIPQNIHPKVLGWGVSFLDDDTGNIRYLVGWFDKSIVTLSHELNHVTFMILKHVGVDSRNDIGEVHCYLHDALMNGCNIK